MTTPKYLRFAQALALLAFAPGCEIADETPPADVDSSDTPVVAAPTARIAPIIDRNASPTRIAAPEARKTVTLPPAVLRAPPGSGEPHSSGPIVPPELPESFT